MRTHDAICACALTATVLSFTGCTSANDPVARKAAKQAYDKAEVAEKKADNAQNDVTGLRRDIVQNQYVEFNGSRFYLGETSADLTATEGRRQAGNGQRQNAVAQQGVGQQNSPARQPGAVPYDRLPPEIQEFFRTAPELEACFNDRRVAQSMDSLKDRAEANLRQSYGREVYTRWTEWMALGTQQPWPNLGYRYYRWNRLEARWEKCYLVVATQPVATARSPLPMPQPALAPARPQPNPNPMDRPQQRAPAPPAPDCQPYSDFYDGDGSAIVRRNR